MISHVVTFHNDGLATVHVECPLCGRASDIVLGQVQYHRWMDGAMLQNVVPEMPPTQRERLISGTCNVCRDKMFPPEPTPMYTDEDAAEMNRYIREHKK